MGMATNRAIEGRAWLEGAGLFKQAKRVITEFASALKQLHNNEERQELQR
jgi:hypothetical protein